MNPPGYGPDCVRDMYTIQLQVICTKVYLRWPGRLKLKFCFNFHARWLQTSLECSSVLRLFSGGLKFIGCSIQKIVLSLYFSIGSSAACSVYIYSEIVWLHHFRPPGQCEQTLVTTPVCYRMTYRNCAECTNVLLLSTRIPWMSMQWLVKDKALPKFQWAIWGLIGIYTVILPDHFGMQWQQWSSTQGSLECEQQQTVSLWGSYAQ